MCNKCHIACLDSLKIRRRIITTLRKNNINTIEDLVSKTREELRKMQLGAHLHNEIKNALALGGYSLSVRRMGPRTLSDDDSITKLNLSVRAKNCLINAKILTIKDILNTSENDILKIRNLGSHCYKEIKESLFNGGIELKDSYL